VNSVPGDDAPVEDPTLLFRRVSPRFIQETDNGPRVSKGAFQNTTDTDEMSVALGDTLAALDREPESIITGHAEFGVVSLTAGFVRNEEEQTVRRSQTDEEPAHGDVIGEKTPARRKRFALRSVWVVCPPRRETVTP
jgi:hypothetical protein